MPGGLFVTGTDTGVGKTVVSAALMHRYRRDVPVRYWKPIQTGVEHDDDTAEVVRLSGCTGSEVLDVGVRLARPVSPHLAARLSGCTIVVHELLEVYRRADTHEARWIVEGAGGVLVPINDTDTIADLMAQLMMPAVVVARTALGTINHSLLTLEALRRRSIEVAGVVMVGRPDPDARLAIETHGRVAVVGEVPPLDITCRALGAWAPRLDPAGALLGYLR